MDSLSPAPSTLPNQTLTLTSRNGTDGMSICDFSPLPVEFLNLEIIPVDKTAEVRWSTASEKDNDFFTIERSLNGVDFEELGQMDGAGDSEAILHYSFIDERPLDGISFYRLKQTDFDGKFEYSWVVSLNYKSDFSEPLFYPNPLTNSSKMEIPTINTSTTEIQFFDLTGKSVQRIVTKNSVVDIRRNRFRHRGIYLYMIIQGGIIIGKGKLLVR